MRAIWDRIDEAGATLAAQGMPSDEVDAVLGAPDARTVHRYLELHRERLAERLDADRLAVDLVERILADERDVVSARRAHAPSITITTRPRATPLPR